jgi:hypothetical protein
MAGGMEKRTAWAKAGKRLLLMGAFLAMTGAIREDELKCEQAVARLVECCPGFVASNLECVYGSGCIATQYPAISMSESDCIVDLSCDELVDAKVCERAMNAEPAIVNDPESGIPNQSRGPEVCP